MARGNGSQAPTSQSQPTDSAGPNAKSKAFDIEGVISSSTSEVALSELSKKGFKQVKVFNQAVITRLITAAVDQVITARSKNINRDERNKITWALSFYEPFRLSNKIRI